MTFTGSIVAFLKLAGKMSSRPLILPGRHLVNSSLLGANLATMGAFVSMAPGAPLVAAGCLAANTVLSFLKGYTTTAAIGGADMRTSILKTVSTRCVNQPSLNVLQHVLAVVITVLNAYSGFALVAEGFMLDNPLLTTVGSLIGVSGSILSYIMVSSSPNLFTLAVF